MAARARPCAARNRLFGLINSPKGALCAPPSIAASYSSKIKITYFPKQNASLQAQTRAATDVYLSTGLSCTLTELHCTLLSYAATSWATLCPILSYPAPCWATMHSTELCCIQLSYVALRFTLWAKLHPTELHCTLLSYAATSWATLCPISSSAAPCWATMHPTQLCCIQLSYVASYLSYTAPYLSYAAT